jgi:hypothetical protein
MEPEVAALCKQIFSVLSSYSKQKQEPFPEFKNPLLPSYVNSNPCLLPNRFRVECPVCGKNLHVNSLRKHYLSMRHYKLDKKGNPVTRVDKKGKHQPVLQPLPKSITNIQNAYRRECRETKEADEEIILSDEEDEPEQKSEDEASDSPEGDKQREEEEEEEEVDSEVSDTPSGNKRKREEDTSMPLRPIAIKARKRAFISLPAVAKEHANPFITYLTSKARGCLSLSNNAEQQGSNYCRFLKFEHPDNVPDELLFLNQDEAVGGLADIGRAHRFLEVLEHKYQAKSKTLVNWIQSMMSIWKWRLVLFSHIPSRDRLQDEALRRYEDIIRIFSEIKKGYKRADNKAPRVTLNELINKGEWITVEELRSITEKASTRFNELCEKRPEELLITELEYGLQYAIFYYYANQPAVRPQIIQSITLEDWETIEKDGVFSTQKFKTKQTYGSTTIILSAECIEVWRKYKDKFRSRSACLSSCNDPTSGFFIRANGSRLKNIANELHPFITHFKPGSHITPTTIRKAIAVEAIDRLSKEEADAIHRGDTHSLSVVSAFYDTKASVRVADNANKAYAKLGNLARRSAIPQIIIAASENSAFTPRTSPVQPEAEIEPPPKKKRKRISWTTEEKKVIQEWCEIHQENREWAECLRQHRDKFLPEHRSSVSIKDCFRSMQKAQERTQQLQLNAR